MKKSILSGLLLPTLVLTTSIAQSQHFTDKAFPLSKQASNGYFRDVELMSDGSVKAIFEFNEKKTHKTEVYEVDPTLNLKKQTIADPVEKKVDGEVKEDYTKNAIWANIGGSNSFDVLSTKLKLFKITYTYKWNKEKQRYYRNVTNRETVKLKNAEDKAYIGFMSFANSNTGELFALTAIEQKKSRKFYLLNVKDDLSFNEIDVPLTGEYTLAYSFAAQKDVESNEDFDVADGDMVFIFAPGEKSPDLKKYIYLRYDNSGKLVEQMEINMPSPNTIITSSRMVGKDLYFFGSYTKSKDAFEEVYGEYGTISSPGYNDIVYGSDNLRMFKLYKALEDEEPIGMVFMKVNSGKMEYLTNHSIENMKKVAKKAPTQKKVLVYDGRPIDVNQFNVLENGDMLIAGQGVGRINIGLGSVSKSYKKLYCFHFDNKGNMRAQYGVEPESIDDKFNTLFPIQQKFMLSNDQKSIYWMLLENQSAEGYDGFNDAYNGNKTWYARYFPSMITIDAGKAELTSYETLGNRQYYLNTSFPYFYSEEGKYLVFVGRDLKNKNMWIGKYQMK